MNDVYLYDDVDDDDDVKVVNWLVFRYLTTMC